MGSILNISQSIRERVCQRGHHRQYIYIYYLRKTQRERKKVTNFVTINKKQKKEVNTNTRKRLVVGKGGRVIIPSFLSSWLTIASLSRSTTKRFPVRIGQRRKIVWEKKKNWIFI